jgi:glycosyltransferase involved in cell wall biosynthesis
MKLRVLFVRNLFHPRDFGGNRYPYEVCRRLAARGHELAVVTGSPTRDPGGERGIRIVRYPALRSHPLLTFWSNALLSRVSGLALAGWQPDVVVLSSYDVAFGFGIPRWPRGHPTVFIYHSRFQSDAVDRFISASTWFERSLARPLRRFVEVVQRRPLVNSDTVIAVSEYSRREIEALAPERLGGTAVVPTGVDTEVFRPGDRTEARRALDIPLEARVLLVVGRLVPIKRFDRAIEVVRLLRSGMDGPWRLLIVGAGPEEGRLRDRAAAAGLADVVRFEGHRTGAELLLRHHACDVQLCTSEFENWSLSLLEGLAAGNVVVGTPTGGTPDLLGEVDGALVTSDERPETMARSVADLLESRERLEGLRSRAVAVARNYSWDRIVDRLEEELLTVARRN